MEKAFSVVWWSMKHIVSVNGAMTLGKHALISKLSPVKTHVKTTHLITYRDDYRKLNFFKENYPHVPIIALTATATPPVQKDILDSLHLPSSTKIFLSSFRRPNLHYEVRFKPYETNNPYPDILCFIQGIYATRKKRFVSENSSASSERVEGVCGIMWVEFLTDFLFC